MHDKLKDQLTQALTERANLYDAMRQSDQKVASIRNALVGVEMERKATAERRALKDSENQDNPQE